MASDIDTINAFLSAHPEETVRAALKARSLYQKSQRGLQDWKLWVPKNGHDVPPEPNERMQVGGQWYYRPFNPARYRKRTAVATAEAGPEMVTVLRCTCGGTLLKSKLLPVAPEAQVDNRTVKLSCNLCSFTVVL